MIDKSKVLQSAWKAYRLCRPCINAAGDVGGKFVFRRDFFAKMLRTAWADAKAAATRQIAEDTARAFIAAQARVVAEKVTALPAAERSLRISQLRDELTLLDYAPFGVRTANRRRDLAAELSAFTA